MIYRSRLGRKKTMKKQEGNEEGKREKKWIES
jgi:hypothetical protein